MPATASHRQIGKAPANLSFHNGIVAAVTVTGPTLSGRERRPSIWTTSMQRLRCWTPMEESMNPQTT